ncbi:MAG: undecaprenyl/decaprenyl-phosphate alpha-N-acetylglucosaminyl 1-phosphate transferase [Proteobacteria bacterium]|nr:undecaprenyl/decaprenyl-phosphate alpha-N-acetylglucosaminyl 1-phosphate transferase [Pseudomonadota bacterium]
MFAQIQPTILESGRLLLSDGALCAMTAAATFATTCALQPAARRLGLLDRPAGRKDHAHPTPTTGGIAIWFGLLLGLSLLGRWDIVELGYATAASLLVLIGILDDRYDLRWWLRIGVQCLAVGLVYYSGVSVEHVGELFGTQQTLGLGAWQLPVTMIATVGVINAINMFDGVDGLAGGIVIATFVMFGAAAVYSGNDILAGKLLVFTGAVIGFWVLNMRFPWQGRARVFMGNAGSALLGFTIAWISFRLTQNRAHPVTPILAPWLVATPVIDCVVLIGRRLLHRQSPFHADRNHMHHLMLDGGFSPPRLVLTLMAVNLLLGLAASVALILEVPQPVLVLAFVALCLVWLWLTARRERAVAFFAWLRHPLRRLRGDAGSAVGAG